VSFQMITLQEICHYLDTLLEKSAYTDYCVNGLQVEGQKEVRWIATAVSASLATIQAAVTAGADLLIVHHGIFWNGDNPVIQGVKREKLQLLLENNLSLAAYHLPLDAHRLYGNNWVAATELGWTDLEPFGMFNGKPIGVRGRVPTQTREQFQKGLEVYYRHIAHAALGGKETVSTAALISGGAYKSLPEAADLGIDCFVTGSFDEPVWHQAFEEGINFFAMGHSNTEEVGPRALAQHLHDQFNVPAAFIPIENPF
jgi:dinuclear metal center YbgI/SA1388 family protein